MQWKSRTSKDFKVEDIMPQPLQRNDRPDLSDIFEETMRSNETEKQTGTGEGTETAPTDAADPSEERVTAKRISGKQRRLSLEEYRHRLPASSEDYRPQACFRQR